MCISLVLQPCMMGLQVTSSSNSGGFSPDHIQQEPAHRSTGEMPLGGPGVSFTRLLLASTGMLQSPPPPAHMVFHTRAFQETTQILKWQQALAGSADDELVILQLSRSCVTAKYELTNVYASYRLCVYLITVTNSNQHVSSRG